MVGSDKLPTAALGLDVRGAAAATRRRSRAKASAAWAKEAPCGEGSKGRGVDLKFGGMGRKKDMICLNSKAYVVPSGRVTKEEIHIRREKGQNKRGLKISSIG